MNSAVSSKIMQQNDTHSCLKLEKMEQEVWDDVLLDRNSEAICSPTTQKQLFSVILVVLKTSQPIKQQITA